MKITTNLPNQEMTDNSVEKRELSSSDTISLAIGIPSFIIGIISLIVTVWALYYAKREFFDNRKEARQRKAQERSKVITSRMAQGDE